MKGRYSSWVIAGELARTGSDVGGTVGHQFRMNGADVLFYFTPQTAQQWINELTTITEEETS